MIEFRATAPWPYPPEIDPTRPFGNGDIFRDVCRILKWSGNPDEDDEIRGRVRAIMSELVNALQIVLLFTGINCPAQIGTYRKMRQFDARSWELVEV